MRELLNRKEYEDLLNDLGRKLYDTYEFEIDGIKKELQIKKIQKGNYRISYKDYYLGDIEKTVNNIWRFTAEIRRTDGIYLFPTVEGKTMKETLNQIFNLEIYES